MTQQEKITHILDLIQNPDLLHKLVIKRISEVLPLIPETKLDEIINILEESDAN